MAKLVRVRKWGAGLGIRLPKSFASQRRIVAGSLVNVGDLKIVAARSARSGRPRRYSLRDMLKHYQHFPKELDFPAMGREIGG